MTEVTPDLLTPAKLFVASGLRTQPPTQMRISPSGLFVAYLKSSPENALQMDLWRYDIDEKTHSLWVSAATFENNDSSDVTALTDVERAERERKRQFTFGITTYSWLGQNDHALVSLDGQAYLVDATPTKAPVLLSNAAHRQSAYKASPSGSKISFVRNGDLYVQETVISHGDKQNELRITHDARPTLSNGLADFLAAEEMHRFDGHWWSPCEQFLFYCKVY